MKATGRQPGPRPTQELPNGPDKGPKMPKSGCASTAYDIQRSGYESNRRQPGSRPTQKLQNKPHIGPKIPKLGCTSTAWMHPCGHITHVWTHPHLAPWMHP